MKIRSALVIFMFFIILSGGFQNQLIASSVSSTPKKAPVRSIPTKAEATRIFQLTITGQYTNLIVPLMFEYYTFNENKPNETATNWRSLRKLDYSFLTNQYYQISYQLNTNSFRVSAYGGGEAFSFYYKMKNHQWYLYKIFNSSD